MPELGITIGRERFTGWTEVAVDRSLEHIAGGFEVNAAEVEPDDPRARSFRPGLRCTVDLDGDPVIAGHIEDVSVSWSTRGHEIVLRGRDATGDLVDCAAALTAKSWRNRKLQDIAAEICKPFGIAVRAEVDTGKPFTFAIDDGESAFDVIETMCRQRGVLPVSDGLATLVFTRAGTARAAGRLAFGENIVAASFEFSDRDRFSDYIVRFQDEALAPWPGAAEAATEPEGRAADPAVTRYRPRVITAEAKGDSGNFIERATWEAAVRAGRAQRGAYTVAGWRDGAGALWRPNTIVAVQDRLSGVETDLLIAGVEYTRGQEGTRSVLSVTRPSAFALIALSEEAPLWMP
jgi:prophage tail gpP-like protein